MIWVQDFINSRCTSMGYPKTTVTSKAEGKMLTFTFTTGHDVMRLHNISKSSNDAAMRVIGQALDEWHQEIRGDLLSNERYEP